MTADAWSKSASAPRAYIRRECGGNGSRGAAIAHDTPASDDYTAAIAGRLPHPTSIGRKALPALPAGRSSAA
jgi:hypothetical protein